MQLFTEAGAHPQPPPKIRKDIQELGGETLLRGHPEVVVPPGTMSGAKWHAIELWHLTAQTLPPLQYQCSGHGCVQQTLLSTLSWRTFHPATRQYEMDVG